MAEDTETQTQTKEKYMEPLQASKCKHCGFIAENPGETDEHETLPEPGKSYLTKGSVLELSGGFVDDGIVVHNVMIGKENHRYKYNLFYFGMGTVTNNIGYRGADSLKHDYRVLTPEEFAEFIKSKEPSKRKLGIKEFRRVTQEELEALVTQEEAKFEALEGEGE